MKKVYYTQGFGAAVIALGFLIFAFIKNANFLIRLMIFPFIVCALCFIAQNICLMLRKPKLAHYFHSGFAISFFSFAFGFLIYWCYISIKTGQYMMALFSIPFWIAAVCFLRAVFFKKKTSASNSKKGGKWGAPIVITGFLVSVVLISGIVLLFIGVKDTISNAYISANYESTEGTLVDYGIYNQSYKDGKEHITYYLLYEYKVSGETYTAKTDYGTGTIPPPNSTREIKYDPHNPENAMLGGSNSSHFMLLMGGFFTLGGMVFVLVALQIKGVFDKVKFDVLGTYIGFVLITVAFGIVFFRYTQYVANPQTAHHIKENGVTHKNRVTPSSLHFTALLTRNMNAEVFVQSRLRLPPVSP